jgi:putative hydrolase of the HAD superfamily
MDLILQKEIIMTIKAVIFDFDGTIVDTETLWFQFTKEILKEKFDLDLPLEVFAKCVGTTDDALFQYIENEAQSKIDAHEFDGWVRLRFHEHQEHIEIRKGVLDKLAEAQKLGLKLGIASSSSREWIVGYLQQFGLKEYFPIILSKEDVEKVKPDPALYVKAAEALGVQPEEALAIEDSANGAQAAISAGLNCVVIPNQVTAYLTFPEKALRVDCFKELNFRSITRPINRD